MYNNKNISKLLIESIELLTETTYENSIDRFNKLKEYAKRIKKIYEKKINEQKKIEEIQTTLTADHNEIRKIDLEKIINILDDWDDENDSYDKKYKSTDAAEFIRNNKKYILNK